MPSFRTPWMTVVFPRDPLKAGLADEEKEDLESGPESTDQVTPQVTRLLSVCVGEASREDLQADLGLKDRESLRKRYLTPALESGLIERTIPDKPSSRLQRYRLTEKGRSMLAAMKD